MHIAVIHVQSGIDSEGILKKIIVWFSFEMKSTQENMELEQHDIGYKCIQDISN